VNPDGFIDEKGPLDHPGFSIIALKQLEKLELLEGIAVFQGLLKVDGRGGGLQQIIGGLAAPAVGQFDMIDDLSLVFMKKRDPVGEGEIAEE